jgi:hypothetical protein
MEMPVGSQWMPLVNSMIRGIAIRIVIKTDAKWIVIKGAVKGVIRYTFWAPAGLSAARGLAALRAYLVFLVTNN